LVSIIKLTFLKRAKLIVELGTRKPTLKVPVITRGGNLEEAFLPESRVLARSERLIFELLVEFLSLP